MKRTCLAVPNSFPSRVLQIGIETIPILSATEILSHTPATAILMWIKVGQRQFSGAFSPRSAMSQLGQKRRFDPQPVTSGLPQSTDIAGPARLVRFVPTAVISHALTSPAAAGNFQLPPRISSRAARNATSPANRPIRQGMLIVEDRAAMPSIVVLWATHESFADQVP
jgi:hypothetical protein